MVLPALPQLGKQMKLVPRLEQSALLPHASEHCLMISVHALPLVWPSSRQDKPESQSLDLLHSEPAGTPELHAARMEMRSAIRMPRTLAHYGWPVAPHTIALPQLAKHVKLGPRCPQSALLLHVAEHTLPIVVHALPANWPSSRHMRPESQSLD